jgi:hypothetical protein
MACEAQASSRHKREDSRVIGLGNSNEHFFGRLVTRDLVANGGACVFRFARILVGVPAQREANGRRCLSASSRVEGAGASEQTPMHPPSLALLAVCLLDLILLSALL